MLKKSKLVCCFVDVCACQTKTKKQRIFLSYSVKTKMILIRNIFFLFILSVIDCSIYIHNTQDSPSVEYYDCIYYESMLYCRRPKEPILLKRDTELWNCSQNGILHSFDSLLLNNITVNTILHGWKSGVDKAEEYLHYQKQGIQSNGSENYLCECNHPQVVWN